MKVKVSLTIDVDRESYAEALRIRPADVRGDLPILARNAVQAELNRRGIIINGPISIAPTARVSANPFG